MNNELMEFLGDFNNCKTVGICNISVLRDKKLGISYYVRDSLEMFESRFGKKYSIYVSSSEILQLFESRRVYSSIDGNFLFDGKHDIQVLPELQAFLDRTRNSFAWAYLIAVSKEGYLCLRFMQN